MSAYSRKRHAENRAARPILAAALAVTTHFAMPALASAELCETAARQAAFEAGVPTDVLLAIGLSESGRNHDGRLRPWPWTINEGGAGRWFASRSEALAHVETRLAAGVRNIDIGCFQLNHRWHADAFPDLAAMFDPLANARYAAGFLASLRGEHGDWVHAAGAYHSRTETHASRYRERFVATLALARAAQPTAFAELAPSRAPVARSNGFPLLVQGAPYSAGSIVPDASAGRSPISAALRPLFGG